MIRYHLTTKEPISSYGGATVLSGTTLSDGNYRALIHFEGNDTDFFEQSMNDDENILSYRAQQLN